MVTTTKERQREKVGYKQEIFLKLTTEIVEIPKKTLAGQKSVNMMHKWTRAH